MWEYLVDQLDGDGDLQAYLTECGEQRWELIHFRQGLTAPAVEGLMPEQKGQHSMIFKRPADQS